MEVRTILFGVVGLIQAVVSGKACFKCFCFSNFRVTKSVTLQHGGAVA